MDQLHDNSHDDATTFGNDDTDDKSAATEAALDDFVELAVVGSGLEKCLVGLSVVGQQSVAESDRHRDVGDVVTQARCPGRHGRNSQPVPFRRQPDAHQDLGTHPNPDDDPEFEQHFTFAKIGRGSNEVASGSAPRRREREERFRPRIGRSFRRQ